MSNNPNQYRQYNTPEARRGSHNNLSKTQKAIAGMALGLAVLTGATFLATKTETGKKVVGNLKNMFEHSDTVKADGLNQDYFDDVIGNPSIVFDISKYKPDSIEKNVLSYDNGIERRTIEERTLSDDEVIVIENEASVRSAPVIGKDGESSTIVRANQDIQLDGVKEYVVFSTDNDYADKFFGFKVADLPQAMINEINYDKADTYWVKSGEAVIEKKGTILDSDIDQDEVAPAVG